MVDSRTHSLPYRITGTGGAGVYDILAKRWHFHRGMSQGRDAARPGGEARRRRGATSANSQHLAELPRAVGPKRGRGLAGTQGDAPGGNRRYRCATRTLDQDLGTVARRALAEQLDLACFGPTHHLQQFPRPPRGPVRLPAARPCLQANGCHLRPVNGYLVSQRSGARVTRPSGRRPAQARPCAHARSLWSLGWPCCSLARNPVLRCCSRCGPGFIDFTLPYQASREMIFPKCWRRLDLRCAVRFRLRQRCQVPGGNHGRREP
jgi:hypothetical protein